MTKHCKGPLKCIRFQLKRLEFMKTRNEINNQSYKYFHVSSHSVNRLKWHDSPGGMLMQAMINKQEQMKLVAIPTMLRVIQVPEFMYLSH